VKQIIVEQLGVDESQWITTRRSLTTWAPIRWTSWSWSWLSKRLRIGDPDEDAEKITTVKDAIEYIENKTAKKS